MRLGILTQPLFFNYGGILQAYALQETLRSLGHEAFIIKRESPSMSSRFPNSLSLNIKYLLRRILGRPNVTRNTHQNKLITRNTSRFIKEYIHTSPSLYNDALLTKYYANNPVDGIIVGSDQVWRPCNSPNIFNYFLDFCANDNIKRIAYAVSFGVDEWEFSNHETEVCKELVKKFDAVSVREQSGRDLCKKFLDVEAVHVLDPTMLLNRCNYECFINNYNDGEDVERDANLFCYILDCNDEKASTIAQIEQDKGLKAFYCMPKYGDSPANIERYGEECIYPPVEKWLKSFSKAKMVLTDSFHGTVFSIIFNKPFWVIGNKERGLSRFESLLKTFNLEDRLITADKIHTIDWNKDIDWNAVNYLMETLRKQSIDYLKENLR